MFVSEILIFIFVMFFFFFSISLISARNIFSRDVNDVIIGFNSIMGSGYFALK